jgi:septal ring factor EnvC (AmiA/AmiB activator)
MTKAELEKRLAESNARIAGLQRQIANHRACIAELEKLNEQIEEKLDAREDQDEREAELGMQFAALCRTLDEHSPLRRLPIALRFEFERLAEELGAPRSWR